MSGNRFAIHATPELGEPELEAIETIKRLQSELRLWTAEPRRWHGRMRRQVQAANIRGSNMIEGYNVSIEDAEAIVSGLRTAESTNHDAVRAYQRSMTYVLQAARDPKFEYSTGVLKVLHFIATEFDLGAHPGLLRDGPVYVADTNTGTVRYTGADAQDVPALLATLFDQLNTPRVAEPMVDAAMAHLNLVNIHPFKDGNGRMSRILQTLVLARSGIVVPEFASIEEYLGEYTQGYYEILKDVGTQRWDPEQDARPWVRYCLNAHHVQALSVRRRIRHAERLWNMLEETVAAAGVSRRSVGGIYDATLGKPVTNSSYREGVKSSDGEEVSSKTASTDLAGLVAGGLLDARGAGRSAHYRATKKLERLFAELADEFAATTPPDLFGPARSSRQR